MHPKSWLAVALLALLTSLRAWAEAASPVTFAAALAEHRHAISISAEGISGPGAELLTKAANEAQFVLIGEEHGLTEIPLLTRALYEKASPAFDVYAAEVGEMAAVKISELAKDPRGIAAFDDFQREFPYAIPFAVFREDAELMRLAASKGQFVGLDQEFLLAPPWLLGQVAAALREKSPEAAAAVLRLRDAELAAYQALAASPSPDTSTIFLNQPLPADWPQWKAALAGQPAALRAMESLEESQAIYQLNNQQHYHDSNDQRGQVMKAHWRRATTQLGGPELGGHRALVRLGANHAIRGWSPLNIADFGNFLAELSAAQGTRSLHVLVLPNGGTLNAWLPFLPRETLAYPIDPDGEDYRFFHGLLTAAPRHQGSAVYDLRPLRGSWGRLTKGSPDLLKILLGYDLVLLIDPAQPAALLPALAELAAKSPAAQ